MKFKYFSIKYRYSNILLRKKPTSFITVCFAAITLDIVLTCIVSVMSASCYVMSASKYIFDVHPRSDSTELAEAVPSGH